MIGDVLFCLFPRHSSRSVHVLFNGDTAMSAGVILLALLGTFDHLGIEILRTVFIKHNNNKSIWEMCLVYSTMHTAVSHPVSHTEQGVLHTATCGK